MMSLIDNDQMLAMIRQEIQREGSQKELARLMGISEAYLSDILSRRRDISDNVAGYFGYEKVIKFRKVGATDESI